jgi:hypothetical protein
MRKMTIGLFGGATIMIASIVLLFVDPYREAHTTTPRRDTRDKSVTVNVGGQSADIRSIIERTHFSFTEEPDEKFFGGNGNYVVEAEHGFVVTPQTPNKSSQDGGIAFRTVSATRESQPATNGLSKYNRQSDGSLSAELSDHVTETLKNVAAGVEQAWKLATIPPGSGDLVVRVAVEGDFVAHTSSGLHFQTPSGLGVVYSNAVWIDHDGRKTVVATEWVDDEIRLRVPTEVLANSTYPAVLDPTVGPEVNVDAPIYGPAEGIQESPAIGHSGVPGNEFLVVWRDERRAAGVGDIFGAHVTSNGTVVDPVGFLITPQVDTVNHTSPSIVWTGTTYIIIYVKANGLEVDARLLGNGTTTAPNATTVRVDSLFGSSGCAATHLCTSPNVTTGATYLYIFWQRDFSISGGSFTLTLSPFSVGLNSGNAAIVSGTNPKAAVSEKMLVDRVLLTDEVDGFIYSTLLDSSAAIIGSPNTPVAGSLQGCSSPSISPFTPCVNHDVGSIGQYGWGVVWEYDQTSGWQIQGRVVDYDEVLAPVFTVDSTMTFNYEYPSIAGHGDSDNEFLVTFVESVSGNPGFVLGRRVSRTGTMLNTPQGYPGALVAGPQTAAHYDEVSNRYLAVWQDYRTTDVARPDIYGGRFLGTTGATMDGTGGFLISETANKERSPAVALCGTNYLVAWTDYINGDSNTDIYGTIISSSGATVASRFVITNRTGNQDQPAVACDGTSFMVVWHDRQTTTDAIYANGISATGAQLNGQGVSLTSASGKAPQHPRIAWSAANARYLVVWDDTATTIYGSSLTSAAVVGAIRQLNPADGKLCSVPDLATAGSGRFLVAWQSIDATGAYDIVGAIALYDAHVFTPVLIEGQSAAQRNPRVAFDTAGDYLVAYEDDRNISTAGVDVYVQLVTPTGATVGSFRASSDANNDINPYLALREKGFVELMFTEKNPSNQFDTGVYGQSIASFALSGAAFVVAYSSGASRGWPTIQCATKTSCMVPYQSFDPANTTTGIDRIEERVLSY